MSLCRARWYAGLLGVVVAGFLAACGPSDPEQAAAYAARGDHAVEQHKFREAIIDYLNAVQYAPDDSAIRWALIQASLHAADYDRTFTELHNLLRREPGHAPARLLLGRLYLTGGKQDDAAHIAKELVATLPSHPAGYLLQGELAVRAGALTQALDRFEQAHRRDGRSLEPILAAGNVAMLLNDAMRAAEWYRLALERHPDSIDVHLARGNYFLAVGDRDTGEREFDRALELGRDSEPARLSLVVQHLAHGRQERAMRELGEVVRALASIKGRALLAELFLETGRVEEGRAEIRELAGKTFRDPATLYLQGRLAMVEHRWTDARLLLSEAIAVQEAKAGPYLWLGRLELLEGRAAKGEALLERAVQLDPDNPVGHLALAELYVRQERYDRAAGESLEVLRRQPGHLQAALIYGDAHVGRDRWREAELVYQAMCTQLPGNPIGYRKMGQLAKKQGLTAKAVTWYAQAVAREEHDVDLRMEYLSALVAAGQGQRADQIVHAAVKEQPTDAGRWEVAARYRHARGRLEEARAAWRTVNELMPNAAGPYYELALLDMAQRKPQDAEDRFRQAIAKDEQFDAALTGLGMLLSSQAKIVEANHYYRKALTGMRPNPVAANNLAVNLLEQGELDEALRYGLRALEAAPSAPSVMDTLGWIYYKKQWWEKASPLLAEAAERLDTSPVVRYHYGMLLAKRGEKTLAEKELATALSFDAQFPGAREAQETLASLKQEPSGSVVPPPSPAFRVGPMEAERRDGGPTAPLSSP
ncbi:MAG: tetratricopeptide repeat protein [Nitrospira sp.]|nr:tetratricopeptide repeat protein [Nitrospira sp.]